MKKKISEIQIKNAFIFVFWTKCHFKVTSLTCLKCLMFQLSNIVYLQLVPNKKKKLQFKRKFVSVFEVFLKYLVKLCFLCNLFTNRFSKICWKLNRNFVSLFSSYCYHNSFVVFFQSLAFLSAHACRTLNEKL